VNPGAIVSGEVVVGTRTLIGAGAVVLQQLSIGKEALIGAGACVTRSIADETTVVGVPARPITRILHSSTSASREVYENGE
jgi:acetyltransferase-like isoleucine patch superfamily enzyme